MHQPPRKATDKESDVLRLQSTMAHCISKDYKISKLMRLYMGNLNVAPAFNEDNVPASVAFVPVSSAIAPASAAIKLFKNYSCPPRSGASIGKRDDAKQSVNMKLAAARFVYANK